MNDQKTNEGRVFWNAVRTSLRHFPIWLLLAILLSLAPLAVASGWSDWLSGALSSRYESGSQVGSLDTLFRHDNRDGLSALRDSTQGTLALAGVAYFLLGVFSGGGWLQILIERHRKHQLQRFCFGGGRFFFRFLRIAALLLLLLAGLSWILDGTPWKVLVDERLLGLGDGGKLEDLDSEMTVVWRTWAKALLGFLFYWAFRVWALFTRTRMAVLDTRSVTTAGAASFFMLMRHPFATWLPMLALGLLELLLLACLWGLSNSLNQGMDAESTRWSVYLLFSVTCLALLWREWMRGARYAAALQVSMGLLNQSDGQVSLGGPGGPRYPIYESDEQGEYGVSV